MTEKEMLDNANKKLRPCPFCGGKAEIKWDKTAEAFEEIGFYKVYCTDCITVHYNYFFTVDDAVARWNERSNTSEVKRGKWETVSGSSNVFCSECGAATEKYRANRYKGCPFCLCIMEGGTDDD